MNIAILGNGFGAIFSAYQLTKLGHKCFLYLDNKSFGGVLNTLAWEKYDIDLGAQDLEVRDQISNDFYEDILGTMLLKKSNPKYGSINNGLITEGLETPDISKENFAISCLNHTPIELENPTNQKISLQQYINYKYGENALPYFCQQIKRFTSASMDELHPININQISFLDRVFIYSNEVMEEYKSLSDFNNLRLGVTYDSTKSEFLGRNIIRSQGYPLNGFKTLVQKLSNYFNDQNIGIFHKQIENISKDKKIIIADNEQFKFDHILSFVSFPRMLKLLDCEKVERKYQFNSGTLLQIFEVEKINEKFKWNYLQNFDLSLPFFRASSINSKFSYNDKGILSVEVPLPSNNVDHVDKNFTQEIWEAVKIGCDLPVDEKMGKHTSFIARNTSRFLTHAEYADEQQMINDWATKSITQFPSWLRGRTVTAAYVIDRIRELNL